MEHKSRAIFYTMKIATEIEIENSTNNTSSVKRMHYISTILKPYEFSLRKYIFLACLMTSVFQYLKFDGSINLRATVWWIFPIV